jgi:death-on-curing family protein
LVWYPSVDDIIDANILSLDLSRDKHPPRLLGSRRGIQVILDEVRAAEAKGLSYQAALLMKRLVNRHLFDGGNHRTAYAMAKIFLRRNDISFRVARFEEAYEFISAVGEKDVEEIQRWIEHGGDA